MIVLIILLFLFFVKNLHFALQEENQQFKQDVFGCSLKLDFFQADDNKDINGLDISNSFFYNEFFVSSFYEDQDIHMKPSFHEYHGRKVLEFEFLRILNNHPRYYEYQDDEERISTSTHMEFCSTEPVYDNYRTKFAEGMEEGVDELTLEGNLLPFSFPSSKFQNEETSIVNGAEKSEITKRKFYHAQEKEIFVDCHSIISLNFYDPASFYMESLNNFELILQIEYGFKLHFELPFFKIFLLLINGKGMDHSRSQSLCWLDWKYTYT
jgi:hypothetical protein